MEVQLEKSQKGKTQKPNFEKKKKKPRVPIHSDGVLKNKIALYKNLMLKVAC